MAKTADDDLAGLAKQLDTLVAAHEEQKLAVVVNFVGEATDEAAERIKAFGESQKLANVALVITGDAEKFKVSDEAEVTVMHYRGKKVAFNAAFAKGRLNAKAGAAIVEAAKKMLAEPVEEPEKPKEKPKDQEKPKEKPKDKPKEKPAKDG